MRSAGLALGGAGALVLEACGSSHSASQTTSTTTTATPGPDVPILNRALDLEHMAIAAYTAATPLLSGSTQLAAKRFLAQEIAHAGELGGLVHQAGGVPVKPRSSYPLGSPRTTDDLLALLYRVEQAQIAVYIAAVPAVSTGRTRAAIAAIFADEAQHSSMIELARGRNPVPSALVRPGR